MTRSSRRTDPSLRLRTLLVAAQVALVALIALHGVAFGHAELVSSVPAANASISTSPPELVLTFTEAIDPANSSLTLLGPNGSPVVGTGALRINAAATPATAALPAPKAGTPTASYRATSAPDR